MWMLSLKEEYNKFAKVAVNSKNWQVMKVMFEYKKFRSSEKFLFYSEKLGGIQEKGRKKTRNLERHPFKRLENQLNTEKLIQVRDC